MGHFLSVVKLVWNVIAIDDGDVGVLGVGFVDQGDGCLVVLCCHSGGCFVVYGILGCLEYFGPVPGGNRGQLKQLGLRRGSVERMKLSMRGTAGAAIRD